MTGVERVAWGLFIVLTDLTALSPAVTSGGINVTPG